MHILLTRPDQQGERTAEILRTRGHQVTHAPLLHIEFVSNTDLGHGPYAAVAITSANAIDAIAKHPQKEMILALPAFVVGERTAEVARRAGFAHVFSADSDVERLAEVMAAAIPLKERVLYLAGADRAGDLAGRLESAGHPVHTVEVYRAVAAESLPTDVIHLLRSDSIHAVLHYSRRSAQTLVRLAATGSYLVNVLKCKHFCLSAQAAEPLAEAGALQVHVATNPDEKALLDLVGIN
jgi:uroporphyrinogen-III synthase